MRLFVSFENVVYAVDVDTGETVGEIKNFLQDKFGVILKSGRNKTDSLVSLMHQGSNLNDSLVYSDLGIPAGTTLVCRVEKQLKPMLTVYCPRYEETIEYKKSFPVEQTLVASLRVMIQNSTGIHVSAFRLYTTARVELFDCQPLKVYGITIGDTVIMEMWHDVVDLVKAAKENDITDTLQALASFYEDPHLFRYQLQLGLFIAAHFGYHQLASQLVKCGGRPNEAIGQHPSRDWCRAAAHPDHMKTAAHEAAQYGHVTCLNHFVIFNYSVLICKDAHGLTPIDVARRFKQTECFKLLVAEQFRIPKVSVLSIRVYSRMRAWCDRARSRCRFHKDKTALLLVTNAEIDAKGAVVGQKLEVDGYSNKGCERESKSNFHLDRTRRSSLSSSSSSRAKSHVDEYTRHSLEEKESNAIVQQHGFSPLSSFIVGRQDTRRTRQNKTHLTRVRSQTTKTTCTKQSGLPGRIKRSFTMPPDLEVGNKENRMNFKERYVWKSLEAIKEPLNEPIDGSTRHLEDEWEKNQGVSRENGLIGRPKPRCTRQPSDVIQRTHVMKNDTSNPHVSDAKEDLGTKKISDTKEVLDATQTFELGYCNETQWNQTSSRERRTRQTITSGKQSINISLQSRDRVRSRTTSRSASYPQSVISADKCLQVASETFRRKNWLGQLRMALVVNTNMCKRRHSECSQRTRTLESRLEP